MLKINWNKNDHENGLKRRRALGYKIEIKKSKTALKIVAENPKTKGTKKPSVFITLLNKPKTYPIKVLKRQFIPNGPALKKSSIKPEIKPLDSPQRVPLWIAKKIKQSKDKSGIAGIKVKFAKTAFSNKDIQRRINELERKYRNISYFPPDCMEFYHFLKFYLQQEQFQALQNQ